MGRKRLWWGGVEETNEGLDDYTMQKAVLAYPIHYK